MPNKRSPTKKIYTVWLDKKKTEEIEELASKNGMTKTEFAQYAFEQAIKNLKEEIKKKNESKNSSK